MIHLLPGSKLNATALTAAAHNTLLILFQTLRLCTQLEIMFIAGLRLCKLLYAVLHKMANEKQHDQTPPAGCLRIQPCFCCFPACQAVQHPLQEAPALWQSNAARKDLHIGQQQNAVATHSTQQTVKAGEIQQVCSANDIFCLRLQEHTCQPLKLHNTTTLLAGVKSRITKPAHATGAKLDPQTPADDIKQTVPTSKSSFIKQTPRDRQNLRGMRDLTYA